MNRTLLRHPAAASVLAWSAAALLVVCWGWLRCSMSRERDLDASAHVNEIMHELAHLQDLRATSLAVAHSRRPDADLITRAQRALADAGLPIHACSGVQPRADVVMAGAGIRVQTVQLSLRGLRPGELGAWLDAWNATPQPWVVSEVQLAHQPGTPGAHAGSALDSNRFDVSVVLSAFYQEDSL
jgi:hypothetical protein